MLPGGDVVRCEVYDGLVCRAVGIVEQLEKRLAMDLFALFEAEHNVLGWLMQGYRDKAEVLAQLALFANEGDRGTKFFGRQRL
jgi:hypothetical protein